MKIININGPINSGKTTICKLLEKQLPSCLFIEVDNLLLDDEQKSLNLNRSQGWAERLKRLDTVIDKEKTLKRYKNILFAYPMTNKTYRQWKLWEDQNTKFINITLAPSIDVCLQNRGHRILNEAEKKRIKQMYDEGYHCLQVSDLIIDNSAQTPEDTLKKILFYLNLNIRPAKPEDAYEIKKIHVETYQKSYRGFVPDEYLDKMLIDDTVIERTKKYLNKTECHLAIYKKRPIGFAYVTYPDDRTFEINALYIHPQYQKCGAGSILVNNLCKNKKAQGCKKCVVWTIKSGPSLPFYTKMKFVRTTEEKMWKFDIPIIKLEKDLQERIDNENL